MTKYLQTLIGRFQELKQGMTQNRERWSLMPESPEEIEREIREIQTVDKEVSEVKKQLSQAQKLARDVRNEKKAVIQKIEKRAIGLHADEEEKLCGYNIKIKRQM